jgi:uncharacterized protein YndB with AHSA1/START domain
MAVKKEPKRRSIELMAVDLPGTPEQVWQAIATGPGISAWFVPSRVEEREGGAVRFQIGPSAESSGKVTAWQPPVRFAYEEPGWSGDAAPLATEFIVEANAGGTCTVRVVSSLFAESDQWDGELESMEQGWLPFFEVLRLYLAKFQGLPPASIRRTGDYAGAPDAAWRALLGALDLNGLAVGQHRQVASGAGAPPLAGTIRHVTRDGPYAAIMQLDRPAPGAALLGVGAYAGRSHVGLSIYFYGADAAATAAREEAGWESWLKEHFPSAQGST